MPLPESTSPSRPICLACDHAHTIADLMLCAGCRQRLADTLAEIRDRFPRLDVAPAPSSGEPSGSSGFGSRPPLKIDVLSLAYAPSSSSSAGRHLAPAADPDSLARTQEPTLVVVGRVADRAREDGLVSPLNGRRTVAGECWALDAARDALARRWWVGEALRALVGAAKDLRRAMGEVETTIPLGKCPRPARGKARERDALAAEHGEAFVRQVTELHCGGEVRSRAYGHAASCGRCGHRWQGANTLRALGEQLGDAMLDLPALARYLEGFRVGASAPSAVLLRKWAQRDGWRRQRVGGRTIYSLADARASAWRAWDRAHPLQGAELPPGWRVGELELEASA